MKLFLLNFVKSKTFKAVLALLAAAVTAYATQGCAGTLSSAQSARIEKFNCQVDALQPIFGELLDTADLARSLYLGNADLGAALAAAGATKAEVEALVEALEACEGPTPVPTDGLSPS